MNESGLGYKLNQIICLFVNYLNQLTLLQQISSSFFFLVEWKLNWYVHAQMFKLEDVAMGIWTDDMKKAGMQVKYVNDDRIYIGGCDEGYLVAHYQQPREMLCLWQKLQEMKQAKCCGEWTWSSRSFSLALFQSSRITRLYSGMQKSFLCILTSRRRIWPCFDNGDRWILANLFVSTHFGSYFWL